MEAHAPVPPPQAEESSDSFDNAKWFSMAHAVADAGKHDKALRAVSPLLPAERPRLRAEALAGAIAAAVALDAETPMGPRTRYVDADGRVYTSVTSYGKKACFMSDPVNRPDGKSPGPMPIQCPASSSEWRKYN